MLRPFSSADEGSKLLPVHIAARHLGRSARTVTRLINNGKLPAKRINRRSWGVCSTDIARLQKRMEEAW
jgi:hypothetical protein